MQVRRSTRRSWCQTWQQEWKKPGPCCRKGLLWPSWSISLNLLQSRRVKPMANPTILEQILAKKVVEVAAAKASRSLNSLEADLLQADPVRGFARAMRDRIS